MKKIIILNHKMSLEYDEVYPYIERINNIDTNNDIVVVPSSLYLESFVNHCNWGVGIQNIHYESLGEYTGEISALQAKSLGCEFAIIGHYERKRFFNEDHEFIKKKLNACLDSNMVPILCFGECGDAMERTLDDLLEGIENINFIVFAYEPLQVSEYETLEQIEDDINKIYNYLYKKYKISPNIVYGGGVEEENINKLLKIDNLNGILIGKVSSDIDKIENIIKSID